MCDEESVECTKLEKEWVCCRMNRMLWGLSLKVKRGERVGVGGWMGGCECDGLV